MATQSIPTGLQTIPLASIIPNINNPRKHFDQVALKELAKSIESHGVRQPILVRPDPFEPKNFELIVGERRWRASKLAGKKDIPAIVDVLSDREALEVMVIENQQRQDVSPLEEARGYQALMNLGADNGTAAHTVESIAAKVGKSVGYVYARLKLIALIPAAAEALEHNHITPGHAVLIARLQPLDQVLAIRSCFDAYVTNFTRDAMKKLDPEAAKFGDITDSDGPLRLMPEKGLREWIQDNVNLKLKGVPWDLADEGLVSAAGSCANCPKRSQSNPALFAELTVKGEDTCFDPQCFKEKQKAFVKMQVNIERDKAKGVYPESPEEPYEPIRQLSEQASYTKPKPDQRILKAGQWLPAKKGECDSVEQGLIVRGEHAGEKKLVCCNGACKVHKHHLQAAPASSDPVKAQANKEAEEREAQLDAAWCKHLAEFLPMKADGADRAALVLMVNLIPWYFRETVTPKMLAKMPLHKAWTELVKSMLKGQIDEDPGAASINEFAKANKLDLTKLEKDFRAKPLPVQTSAKPKKGK